MRLTDFGVACRLTTDNSNETSGTPGYMAPEVMCRKNHGIVVDYFAIGVIAYECMFGKRPYVGKGRREIREQILAKQVQIKKFEIPEDWSDEAANFINKCIIRNPANRLGAQEGIKELKQDEWFATFDWPSLERKEMPAPFVPNIAMDNFDANHVNNKVWKDDEAVKECEQTLRRDSV